MMPLKNIKLLLSVLLFCCPLLQAAQADREQPVEIEADQGSFSQNNMETEFSGNVVVSQGSLKINASKVHMTRDDAGNQKVNATGSPVRFKQDLDEKNADGSPQTVHGHANKIHFDNQTHTITLSGNARIDREGDVVTGPVITYNTATSVYSVKGNPKQKQRVSVVLQPNTSKGKK